jgi:uncharacterized protein YbjT (DUF2867 family)
MDILVTGGTGFLGRRLVPLLEEHDVRVLTRRADAELPSGVAAVRGDLRTGDGLAKAAAGVDVVLHCASSPFRRTRDTDVAGTERLVRSVDGAPHLVYISIVGVDRHPFPYYRAKLQAEAVVESSGLPWTILRATQFHDLIAEFIRRTQRLPITFVPRGFVFQPVDTGEVAARMAGIASGPPLGHAPDMGGPEVRALDDLVRTFYEIRRGRRARIVRLPVPGRIGRAFRDGVHTCPDRADGTITWEQYFAR